MKYLKKKLYTVTIDECTVCWGTRLQFDELRKLVHLFSNEEKNTFLKLSGRHTLKTTPPKDFRNETEHVCPEERRLLER